MPSMVIVSSLPTDLGREYDAGGTRSLSVDSSIRRFAF
jgi:hypothetical protein